MKKGKVSLLALLLASVMVFLCSCGATLDKRSESIVGDQITDEEYSILRDTTNYRYSDDAPKEFVLTDQPILRYFPFLYPQQMAQTPESFVDDAFLWKHLYIVFDEKPILLKLLSTEPITVYIQYADTSLPFIRDLLKIRQDMKILGNRCTVQNVILTNTFDPAPANGVLLYYETNQGVFVRYYQSEKSSGEWFTIEEFTDYAQQYVDALTENARQMMIEPLVGFPSFYDFLKSAQSQTTEE